MDPVEILTDEEYDAIMADLAAYSATLDSASLKLTEESTLARAENLTRLFRSGRWVQEREKAKPDTPKGKGRPIDPMSRCQFAAWLRDRFGAIDQSRTYRLLDAASIQANFLANGEVIPNHEYQVRPLKPLLSVANGSGARVQPVWEKACQIAREAGRDQPSEADVRQGISDWRAANVPKGQARQETKQDRAWRAKHRAMAEIHRLFGFGIPEPVNALIAELRSLATNWGRNHG